MHWFYFIISIILFAIIFPKLTLVMLGAIWLM